MNSPPTITTRIRTTFFEFCYLATVLDDCGPDEFDEFFARVTKSYLGMRGATESQERAALRLMSEAIDKADARKAAA